MKKIVSLAAAFALVASTAQAQTITCTSAGAGTQTCSLPTAVTVTVPTILRLSITDSLTTFAAPTVADFEAGSQSPATTVAVSVKSNTTSTTTIQAGAWTAPWAKPVADLSYKVGAGSFTAFTGAAQPVGPGTAGVTPFTISYKILWAYASDLPGTYTMPITFSTTAP